MGRIRIRRDTTSNWSSNNPTLSQGELGLETDSARRVRVGDGSTAWNTLPDTLVPTFNVRAFGALGNGTTDDRAAFESAIAACPAGGIVLVPRTSSYYRIDNAAGIDDAVLIDKAITVRIEGIVRGTTTAVQANPPVVLYVTADNVTLEGSGTVHGGGTINDVNTGTDATMPSCIRVTGNNFTMRGLTVDAAPKIGVHLQSCTNAAVLNCLFTGGPTSYSDTAYFGIRANAGGRHLIANNRFYPDSGGGMFVSCIFFNASNNNLIEGNIAYRPYEKLVYLNGSYNVLEGNVVIGNTGTIAGTNQTGTVGPCYRMDGTYNKCTSNYAIYGAGFQGILGGTGCDISNNTFVECGQSAITLSGGTAVYDYLTIKNNVCVCGNLAGIVVLDGISVQIPDALGVSRYVTICDNIVRGFANTDPLVNLATWAATTTYSKYSLVKPSVANSRYYELDTTYSSGGVSGGSEPIWPTTAGNTIVDGAVRWICRAYETTAQIKLYAQSAGDEVSRATISRNNLATGARGMLTTFMVNSVVADNQIEADTTGITETNGGTNRYEQNRIETAVDEVSGLAATSSFDGAIAWTPQLSDGTNNATMGAASANAGTVTKRGRWVRVNANVATTSLGSVSGAVRLTGLPYAAAAGIAHNAAGVVSFAGGLAITAGQNLGVYIQGGNSYIELSLWDATTGTTALQGSEWSDDGNMIFMLEYMAAS